MGACMLVRREAVEQVGPLDESFFLFSEETDWCYRFEEAGWKVLLLPRRRVRARRRCLAWRADVPRERPRATCDSSRSTAAFATPSGRGGCSAASLRLRARLFRDERGRMYRDAADWLASGHVPELLER